MICIRNSFTGMWSCVLFGTIAWALVIVVAFFVSLAEGSDLSLFGMYLKQSGDGGFQMTFKGTFIVKLVACLAALGLILGLSHGLYRSRRM